MTMQQTYQCTNCRQQVSYGVRFCGNCGTSLDWQQQTPPPPIYRENTNYQQKQGKPIGMETWFKTLIPYPNEEDRRRLYTHPLTSVFDPYFEKVFIHYYEIEGRLHHFIIRAYVPKFVINQQNEDEFYSGFFSKFCNEVINLFSEMKISAQIHDIWRSYQSFEDYIKDVAMEKVNILPYDKIPVGIEMVKEDVRIIGHADGRYCLAFTNKEDGRRCYTDIPEELAKEIGEQYIYRIQ